MDKPAYLFDRVAEWAAIDGFMTGGGLELAIVSGRRRQGKTLLLTAAAAAYGGFMFTATEATEADSLRQFGEAYARQLGSAAPFAFATWDHALESVLEQDGPELVVLDEFPYLVSASPQLPSVLQRIIDRQRARHLAGDGTSRRRRLILCGSALSFMGHLLSGSAPLHGRAGLELIVPTLDYRQAAEFWGITDSRLAVRVHAIVGGTPAYRREFVRDDAPTGPDDFDAWVTRTVFNPRSPLFREARYLLAEEPNLRDGGLYHSVLAAIAEGSGTRGGIAGYIGRKSNEITHPLSVLQDVGLVSRADDALAKNRSTFRIAEPLITFYHAVMRPIWGELERAAVTATDAPALWRASQRRFAGNVLGPQFEEICRTWAARFADPALFTPGGNGVPFVQVASATVNDSVAKTMHEVDVLVMAPPEGGRRRVLGVGEVEWGTRMGVPQLDRLLRIRDLIAARPDVDARDAVPICFSAAGFTDDLVRVAAANRALLLTADDVYGVVRTGR